MIIGQTVYFLRNEPGFNLDDSNIMREWEHGEPLQLLEFIPSNDGGDIPVVHCPRTHTACGVNQDLLSMTPLKAEPMPEDVTEQSWPDMPDKFYEALGWMHAECCVALDRGDDPRLYEVGDMVERCIRDLTRDTEAEVEADRVPEVGQECESYPFFHKCYAVCEYEGDILIHDKHEDVYFKAGNTKFRPIQPNSDWVRDESVEEMARLGVDDDNEQFCIDEYVDAYVDALYRLYDAGTRMTRELTDDDIKHLAHEYRIDTYAFARAIEAHVRGE